MFEGTRKYVLMRSRVFVGVDWRNASRNYAHKENIEEFYLRYFSCHLKTLENVNYFIHIVSGFVFCKKFDCGKSKSNSLYC